MKKEDCENEILKKYSDLVVLVEIVPKFGISTDEIMRNIAGTQCGGQ